MYLHVLISLRYSSVGVLYEGRVFLRVCILTVRVDGANNTISPDHNI